MAFTKEGVVNLDFHTGNQLYSLRDDYREFVWSDFGASFKEQDVNQSIIETFMYKHASSDFFQFLRIRATATADAKLQKDVDDLEQLHANVNMSRADPVIFFTNMTAFVQQKINKLDSLNARGVLLQAV
jgi:CRISPR/Cas system CSM-associated protein Csm5 (group 7 of RAMP superfamily)